MFNSSLCLGNISMLSGPLISLYVEMAVGKECLGLAENFEEMKRWAYRKSTIKPPPVGGHIYFKLIWGGGGLIWEGAGASLI